ncbi:HU family DNA-binding protein [Chryseobacterium terrae]|uniref:HU family DNA-binding protein n=1 Tax=Chryseobacterium terrae TaxID=3163299 RepID=UPI0038B5A9BC
MGEGITTLQDLAKYASTVSTVSKADILAVLESTFSKIADDVADGKIVYVGEYFTLQAGGSSEGKETADEVNASSIKSVRTLFRPGKMIKDALKLAEFKKKAYIKTNPPEKFGRIFILNLFDIMFVLAVSVQFFAAPFCMF